MLRTRLLTAAVLVPIAVCLIWIGGLPFLAFVALLLTIAEVEFCKRDAELAKMYGQKGEIAFGNQIRSYVLHPYRMVKDLRTGVEVGDVDRVMDGDLDNFIEAYLKMQSPK